ncbi:MAG: hypothetical protein L3K19_09555 [Thermoplasmata archaeon]|nr:hypothetical protein [Thermoplasmata archaeon]
MAGEYRSLIPALSGVSVLVLTVVDLSLNATPAAGQPVLPSFFLLVGLGVLLIALVLSLFFVPEGGSNGLVGSDEEGGAKLRSVRVYRRLKGNLGTLLVVVVLVALLASLPSVQVSRDHSSGQQTFLVTFPNAKPWTTPQPISMGGFGELVFNWSELTTYNQLHVTLNGKDGFPYYDQYSPVGVTEGYGGLVLGPGTYALTFTESASVGSEASVTFETSYSTTGALLSW